MLPYFYNLQKRIISDSFSTKLISIYNENKESFAPFKGPENRYDGNRFFPNSVLVDYSEIQSFQKTCVLENRVLLLMQPPHEQVIRHIDRPPFRKSAILTPLLPALNYAPTNFYENDVKVTEIDFKDRNSVLFNTQKFHDVKNGDSVRLNFQIVFSETFEEVLDLVLNDRLFK
jgi:hypothetical protein